MKSQYLMSGFYDELEKLGFDWGEAIFDSIDYVYSKKYDISIDKINNHTPKIVFEMENPFIVY